MRYGGREVETDSWVEGNGVYTKIWWVNSARQEKTYILSTTPAGTELRTEIKPDSLRFEIDDRWRSEGNMEEVFQCLTK